MKNKLRAKDSYMPTEFLKMLYVQSRVADNPLAQISTRLDEDAARPFTTAKEMLVVLTAAFGNKNRKREARMEYRSLRQGTRDFNTLWAEFQRLAAELDHSDETLIDDVIEKCHVSIQRHLVAGEEDPTDLLQLATRCQRIEQGLKKVERSQFVHDRNAERNATRKNAGTANRNNATSLPPPLVRLRRRRTLIPRRRAWHEFLSHVPR